MPHNKTYDDRAIAPFQLYVMAQYMSALYMLVSVVLTYAAGRTAFNRRAGLIAAAGRGAVAAGGAARALRDPERANADDLDGGAAGGVGDS